ncbi:ABC transporter ATP-binding protein [Gordonia sp. NPDC003424]
MTPPIVIEHLTKTFGAGRGITDVGLTVEDGEVCGFLGPNGAGKSTTIRCLLGLYRPDGGRALVLGHDIAHRGAEYLRRVGYLPGELTLPGSLSGGDVLARFGRMRGLTDTTYRDELCERLGVELERPIRTLSKGNKQKLGIVLAFMHRPDLLVLDEPTSGLDPLLQDEFAALVGEFVEAGRAVLLSSHDLAEVQRLAHRVAIIRSGQIVVNDTVEALRANSPGSIELDFSHDVDVTMLGGLPGVTIRSASPRHVVLTQTGPVGPVLSAIASLDPDIITARPADLDELFLRVYDHGGGGIGDH